MQKEKEKEKIEHYSTIDNISSALVYVKSQDESTFCGRTWQEMSKSKEMERWLKN